ncbi:MAG: hypothetical protein HY248_01190, partial [Fimbriimonas ginsengisoli]|nr:hypothetical protein [Fimbriimonas ginsengisoli]
MRAYLDRGGGYVDGMALNARSLGAHHAEAVSKDSGYAVMFGTDERFFLCRYGKRLGATLPAGADDFNWIGPVLTYNLERKAWAWNLETGRRWRIARVLWGQVTKWRGQWLVQEELAPDRVLVLVVDLKLRIKKRFVVKRVIDRGLLVGDVLIFSADANGSNSYEQWQDPLKALTLDCLFEHRPAILRAL